MAANADTEESPKPQYTTLQADTITGYSIYVSPGRRDHEYMYMEPDSRQTNEQQLSSTANSTESLGKQHTEQKSTKSYCLCALVSFLIISIILNFMLIVTIVVLVAIMGQPSVAASDTALTGSPSVQLETFSLQNYLSNVETIAENITAVMENIANSVSQFEEISEQNLDNLPLCMSNNSKETPVEQIVGVSCEDIRSQQPDSPSGYYTINNQTVYCEMGELCGSEGGWTRLAYLDMNNTSMNCPEGFRLYEDGVAGIRACGRQGSNPCSSIQFPSNNISYSEVCGRVVGYQYGSSDAVNTGTLPPAIRTDINSQYVDGVSITRGNPRQHVWTLMAGFVEVNIQHNSNCPCNTNYDTSQLIPSFIGRDYFCESGNPSISWRPIRLYSNDPLWDGEGCGSAEANCCAVPGLPWFHKALNSTTTDYLELRVCADENTENEDVPVSFYELYVK